MIKKIKQSNGITSDCKQLFSDLWVLFKWKSKEVLFEGVIFELNGKAQTMQS